jgi:TPR repeat protein
MARTELLDVEGMSGEAFANADMFFNLGMTYSSGHSAPPDLVSAHKWFNIAATHGHADAARRRREIAAEMSDDEIAAAQRAAREWARRHCS